MVRKINYGFLLNVLKSLKAFLIWTLWLISEFFFLVKILLIYFWLHWVCVVGFSLQWLLLVQSMGSRCVGFSSCSTGAQLLQSMWDLPRSGIEPVSPAFLTTGPPGKSTQQSSKRNYTMLVSTALLTNEYIPSATVLLRILDQLSRSHCSKVRSPFLLLWSKVEDFKNYQIYFRANTER